jgi:hypothetical protein
MNKIDDHHRLESHVIPRNTRFSKWVEIQQQPLSEPNPRATLRVAKCTSWCSESMVDRPFGKARSRMLTAAAAVSQKCMEENGMMRAPHLPSLPDLAPSDFYLFGYVKHFLRGQSFETAGEFFPSSEVI